MSVDVAQDRERMARRRSPLTAFAPGVLLAMWTVLCLRVTGVALVDSASFAAYVALGLTLPGTLLWRILVARSRRPWLEDLVFGTILAYAVEIATYLPARAVGAPRWAVLWAAAVLVVATALPSRSSWWRPRETERLDPRVAWGLAGVLAFAVGWLARYVWWNSPIEGAALRFPYVDAPFQLGLVTELRHHFPAQFPYVPDEPLQYHWFVHAEVAASSWGSGVDALVLLQRMSPLLMVLLVLSGSALVVARLTGSTAWGLAAPVLLVGVGNLGYLSSDPNLFLSVRLFLSPTHTFGTVAIVLVLRLVLQVLVERTPRPGVWIALAIALGLTSGAKATFLPLVLAGAAAVVVVALLLGRRLHRPAVAVLVLAVAAMAAAQVWVIGLDAPGIGISPLGSSYANVQMLGIEASDPSIGLLSFAVAAYLLPNLTLVAGFAAFWGRSALADARVVFLGAAVVASVGASYVFVHPDFSQFYFLWSALAPAAVLSAWGLQRLVSQAADADASRWLALRLAGGLAVGAAYGLALALAPENAKPNVLSAVPIVLVLLVGTVAALTGRTLRRGARRAGVALALVGLGLSQTFVIAAAVVADPVPTVWTPPAPDRRWEAAMSPGGISAARWVRRHTDPDDRIATNVHCKVAKATWADCDRRSFSLSAYSERRVLLEGWAYNPRNATRATDRDLPACCVPFWDPALLAANDAVFESPSEADVDRLSGDYGVRWLVVNRELNQDWGPLLELTQERFRSGKYLVLEIPPRRN